MKRNLFLILLFFTCGVLIFSCNNQGKRTVPLTPTNESLKPQTFTPLTETEENVMIAKVNGSVINRTEVYREMNNLLEQIRNEVPPDQIEHIKPKLWKQAVENLINFKLLLQEAEKQNIQLDNKAIDEQIQEIVNQFSNYEKFREQLAVMEVSEEDLRKDIGENLKIEALLKRQTEKIPEISDKDIKGFYQDHPENFKIPEKIQASHILISIDPSDNPEERAEKRQRLLNLQDEIKNGGDFAQIASEYSDCPTKSNGGDLGLFERGEMIEPFDDAAFQLKVGEMSDIVETEFGYHLIKVTDRHKSHNITLKEAHDKILSYLHRQKKKQVINDYLLTLRNAVKIEYAEGSQP